MPFEESWMSGVTFKSNEKAFFALLGKQTTSALNKMGKVGLKNIKERTPEITGDLKRANTYDVKQDDLYFINDMYYASYNELGTMYMAANPFMRTGIINSNQEFYKIMVDNLKV